MATTQTEASPTLAVVRETANQPTWTPKHIAQHRKDARAEFAIDVGIAAHAHGGWGPIAKALDITPDGAAIFGTPHRSPDLTFGDALAAARHGQREWVRSLCLVLLGKLDLGAPVADVHPLRHGNWIGAAAGEVLRCLDDALADNVLKADEAREVLKEIAVLEAKIAGCKRLLEAKARSL